MTKIISQKEAKARGLVRYFTGKACPSGHISERFTSSRQCQRCNYNYPRFYEKKRERARKYYAENSEKLIAKSRKYQAEDPEKCRKYQRERYRRMSSALQVLRRCGIEI